MTKVLNQFDYITNVRCAGGCQPCTRPVFEKFLDDQEVKNKCAAVARIRNQETSAMSETERRELKDRANSIKLGIMAILPHGHSQSGQRGNQHMTPSPWCSMDIDDVENPRELFDNIRPGLEALHCPIAFVSPSGCGLKFFVPMVEGLDRKEAQKYFADVLHLPKYDSTPDLARCCFMVPRENLLLYKPELLFASEVELLPHPGSEGAIVPYEEDQHPPIEDADIIEDEADGATAEAPEDLHPTYHGIPISRIIEVYWIVNNLGKTPRNGERNDLTYELALGMRHICDYDLGLMKRVIPCYDGLPDSERINCIESALKRPRSKMPAKMLKTLNYLRKEQTDNADFQQFLLDIEEENNGYYFKQIKSAFAQPSAYKRGIPRREWGQLPAGLRETLAPFPDDKAMPVIVSMATMIPVLATDVRLTIRDDDPKALNLQCYIVGSAGSGKSKIDNVDKMWMMKWREKQKVEIQKQRVYEEQLRVKRNAKEMPKDPHAKILEISCRTSTSKLLINLENAQGAMCYSYLQEADMSSSVAGQSFNRDMGVIQRCAYDETRYDTSYMNHDTGTRIIEHTRWNFVKCCTPDALYRAQKGYLNGEITRLAIVSMPDNTFAPFKPMPKMKAQDEQNIIAYSELIMLMQGNVRLPEIERGGCEWQERTRL